MTQIVKIEGVDHLIVTPSKPFMNSSMITSVLKSGRQIGVNLQTGMMVIVKPRPEKVCIFEYDGNARKVASDRQVGLIQIEDLLETLSRTLGDLSKCEIKFYIKEGERLVYLTTLIDNNQREFLRQVSYAYSKVL
jgi:hypothetical protein